MDVSTIKFSIKARVINRYLSLSSVLNKFSDNRYEIGRSCFCPSPDHHNVNTKAAKLFLNSDGSESVYCWNCRKNYGTIDALRWYSPGSIDKVFVQLWDGLSDVDRNSFLVGGEHVEVVSVKPWLLKLDDTLFRSGQEDYGSFLGKILELYVLEGSK